MRQSLGRLLGAAATILVLAVCAFLPPTLARESSGGGQEPQEPQGTPALTESVAPVELLSISYDTYSCGALPFTRVESLNVSAASRGVIQDLSSLFRVDFGSKETILSTGEYYYEIQDSESGVTVNVIEYYREWIADWTNWLRVAIDADTGDVYYAYSSSGYRLDNSFYRPAGDMPTDVREFMGSYQDLVGLELTQLTTLPAKDGYVTEYEAEFAGGERRIYYDIHFNYVEAVLVDIEINIKSKM